MSDDAKYLDKEGRYWRIPKWFPKVNESIQSKLLAFHKELLFFNGRMNLISPRTEKAADSTHFADAILGSRLIYNSTKMTEIFDIGSGNGIPGLVFSILFPEIAVQLVDVDARRIEFLKHCISRLRLENCRTAQKRLEDLDEGGVHYAMCRGFASINKVLLQSRKIAASDCHYYHFKGPTWPTEMTNIPPQVLAHWECSHIGDYELPESEKEQMSIILTKKVS